jgi:hypothetical protein
MRNMSIMVERLRGKYKTFGGWLGSSHPQSTKRYALRQLKDTLQV